MLLKNGLKVGSKIKEYYFWYYIQVLQEIKRNMINKGIFQGWLSFTEAQIKKFQVEQQLFFFHFHCNTLLLAFCIFISSSFVSIFLSFSWFFFLSELLFDIIFFFWSLFLVSLVIPLNVSFSLHYSLLFLLFLWISCRLVLIMKYGIFINHQSVSNWSQYS